jgi:large subunit ribosomal protein L6e
MARSSPIAPNVGRLSRSQVAAKRGLYKGTFVTLNTYCRAHWLSYPTSLGKKTGAAPAKEEKPTTFEKSVGGAKNGEKRTISTDKAQKYYPVSGRRKRGPI